MTNSPRPSRWLVFGGSGAVGRFLLPALVDAGCEVLAMSRSPKDSGQACVRWLQGSLEDAPALDALLDGGARFDVLCSLGPLDAFSVRLAQHPPACATRVLALSSLSAEWKRSSPNPDERALARTLVDSEQLLMDVCAAHKSPATVLRCGLIHGAGIDRSLSPLLRWARKYPLPWPRAAQGLRQPVHARDLARAVLAAAGVSKIAQRVLCLPGPEALSFPQMLQRTLAAEGASERVLPVPLPGIFAVASVLTRVHGRVGARAATLRRLFLDQLSPCEDWALLGIPLHELSRVGAAAEDQFQNR